MAEVRIPAAGDPFHAAGRDRNPLPRFTDAELAEAIRVDEARLGRPMTPGEREGFARGVASRVNCRFCGATAPVLKTVRWRSGAGRPAFALCDPCYGPLASILWIIPGPVPAFGTCRSCGTWVSVNPLRKRAGGGRQGAPTGLCGGCEREPE